MEHLQLTSGCAPGHQAIGLRILNDEGRILPGYAMNTYIAITKWLHIRCIHGSYHRLFEESRHTV